MFIYEFEDFLNEVADDYKALREMHGRDEALRLVAPRVKDCCSRFEEETLIERLREEYLRVA